MPQEYALVPIEIGDDGEEYLDTDRLTTISGDDIDGVDGDEVGRAKRRGRKVKVTRGRKAAKTRKTKVRSGIFGLNSVTVQAGLTGELQASVQEPVYLQRLVLDGDTGYFTVSELKIGAKSMLSGTEPFPAGAFKPDATNAGFSVNRIARVGQDVTVGVTNIDANNARSLSGMFKTLEHWGSR